MKSETCIVSSKESSFYIMKHLKRKNLLLFASNLIEKYLILLMLKNTMNQFKEKKKTKNKKTQKVSKTIRNNHLSTKNF